MSSSTGITHHNVSEIRASRRLTGFTRARNEDTCVPTNSQATKNPMFRKQIMKNILILSLKTKKTNQKKIAYMTFTQDAPECAATQHDPLIFLQGASDTGSTQLNGSHRSQDYMKKRKNWHRNWTHDPKWQDLTDLPSTKVTSLICCCWFHD